ncbi:hypothetical protein DDR33_24770 [Pararcticibacter amylolyticus]|uniref:Uncharacterized protein n=1 Tax=Pararcticibacter amylolyticus TaxID=2173175 RepID=A0A2U2P999_9SPHI|nr:hypothetical protein DDR33_24770 [Pararcticibacter amylolyticus]
MVIITGHFNWWMPSAGTLFFRWCGGPRAERVGAAGELVRDSAAPSCGQLRQKGTKVHLFG